MKTPILFIVFNRPETTARVFSTIKKARPQQLFIAADGPRKNLGGEEILCGEVRKIVEEVDWPCRVKRLYRKRNLGCKKAVSSAIDWFFKHVPEGIILEDDCSTNVSFFKFCEAMLSKYRRHKKIMHIGGSNFQPVARWVTNGYYFSRYAHIWGWATWRRAWKKYDVRIRDWLKTKKQWRLDSFFTSRLEKEYWFAIFDAVYKGKIDTWDYQWLYAIWKSGGRAICPGVNLVANVGGEENPTHNTIRHFRVQSHEIKFPLFLLKDTKVRQFDDYVSRYHYGINLPMVIYQKIKYSQ